MFVTGEVFGFLGPNGAGKTTTLKLLMQLVYPTSGTATILGRPLGDVAMKRRIGYLPENPYLYDYLTAEELLDYFASLFGYRGAERRARVSRLLDEVGLGAERTLQLRKFSKGMIQRVGLAQALVNDPEVVFLDEPMSGLDPLGRRDVRTLILKLRDEGRTVFFSSHILSDAESLCTRIAIVAKGRMAAAGKISDLLARQIRRWDIVVDEMPEPPGPFGEVAALESVRHVSGQRYAIEASPREDPMRVVTALLARGGRLVSINPVHETLEDLFVRHADETSTVSRVAPDERDDAAPRVARGR